MSTFSSNFTHHCLVTVFPFPVSESKHMKEPVAIVIERELKTLLDGNDIKQFNADFLEKHSHSLLHRFSGE